ncbi:hypothetical protein CCAL9344_00770 [Campylobacter sp. RM9344]|uniref:asparagine synthase (glutamine-hydrolyzing) n=1 Tax=Campylobacter californiensis TaxID=1032243 RepID=A0AAW3ZV79_9BACT|nr:MULTISPECIES: asparagine synthase-related protein [unclassified Campylobacter]MBE2983883.1 hypothetical protein [Campylobacter sp. RM6883]MBE2994421.1 hypothetical protein [Campylobacter sp. RM6913]MBE3028729.1 hypothetical protein [Campylobacter sp. RM9344]MBE3607618.1 hypothetical protein [Campylobacter sp. RM9337]QCD51010.1 asparagine synthase (glutamine-hydrolyzing) [Campylobacter sp. RM6914]
MPGIYGYVKNAKEYGSINNMSTILHHHKNFIKENNYEDNIFAASHIHLGNIKHHKGLFFRNGIYISIEGEQYDYSNSIFEDLMFNAYMENNLDYFLNKLDGYFNAIIYDSINKKVFLISDRYGMRMLYYYYKDGDFAFSGEVKGLFGLNFVDNEIDSNQIDVFMDLGYLLEDNTWHKHIKLIKPATILEFDITSKELTQRYYWKWSEINYSDMCFDEAVDRLGDLWLKSVEKRFSPNSNIGVSLSGGLDSRAIFAAINAIYPDSDGVAYTFGIPNCDDMRIAKQCVAQTKWTHREFYLTDNNWFEPRKDRIWFTDGMFNLKHMHGSEFLDEISELVKINMNGYAGDAILGGGWLDRIPLDTYPRDEFMSIFYGDYVHKCNFVDTFYDIKKIEPHLFMNRVRRFTNMGTVNSLTNIDQRKPFFDNKIVEFIYSLPDSYRQNNSLYSSMLLKFFPKFYKNIPWQNTGKTIDKKVSSSNTMKIIKKIKRIPFKLGLMQDSGYTNYIKWINEKNINHELHKILNSKNAFYSKYTNIDFEVKYLNKKFKGIRNYDEKILRATTIEIYLQKLNILKTTE